MKDNSKFDLEDRTSKFSEDLIKFCKKIPRSPINDPLLNQLIRSGTSIGANYCEADDAESRQDFKHKIGICKKVARETKYWLKMIVLNLPVLKSEAGILEQEAKELNLIFNAIINSTRKNDN